MIVGSLAHFPIGLNRRGFSNRHRSVSPARNILVASKSKLHRDCPFNGVHVVLAQASDPVPQPKLADGARRPLPEKPNESNLANPNLQSTGE
jgi:hypothetical protein